MVHLDGLKRRFGPRILFEGLSWRIPPNARIGLVGPNGTGKTTLLRIIAGLDEPDAGAVHRASGFSIAYLPQEVEVVREGTVLDVVLEGLEEVRAIGRRLEELERRMATLEAWDADAGRIAASWGEASQRFEMLGGHRAEARARAVLTGLGVPESRLLRPLKELSGGWRMRVLLARLLVAPRGLLLLDEPTNHLDLAALSWLEGFLEGYEGGYVVVSHDRYLLNRLAEEIAELDGGRLVLYAGNYDAYLETRAGREAARLQAARLQAREIARVERFVERFRYKASKARQVQSRIKALGKLERVEAPRPSRRRIRFGFPAAPRSGEVVARAEDLSKSFDQRVVYHDARLLLRRGDRVALLGPNGAGKSTLLRLLAGLERPTGGTLELGHNVVAQYYAQHQLEALDPRRTVMETVQRAGGSLDSQRLRSLLGCFLFHGDDVEKRVEVLSGGERARLALCRMLLHPANLLLLDEPTNHLDTQAREVLEDALDEYGGTLVFVSHDRYFINRVATSVAEIGDGRIDLAPGDYDEHLRRRAAAEPAAAEPVEEPSPGGKRSRREARRAEAEERARRYRERRIGDEELERLEDEIARSEEALRELTARQADPQTYRDPETAARVGRERVALDRRLRDLYQRWESLAGRE